MSDFHWNKNRKISAKYVLTGRRFGNLIVQEFYGMSAHQKRTWMCLCDCGKRKPIIGVALINGKTVSCGCAKSDLIRRARTKHGHTSRGTRSSEYTAWCNMIARCYNPNYDHWKDYGGRGIKVHPRWLESFDNFLADMGKKPKPGLTLERLDNDLDYEPGNCVWDTWKVQNNHKRNNLVIEHLGVKRTATQWEEELGLPAHVISKRLRRGWTFNEALQPSKS